MKAPRVADTDATCDHGRRDAGVFPIGLLLASDTNPGRRDVMGEVLRAVRTKPCADVLFAELRRVKSWNTMRRHLAAVIKVLESLPAEVIQDGFAELAANKSFSRYMRDKFGAVMASAASPDDE